MASTNSTTQGSFSLLSRPPETLVIKGYREWLAGIVSQDTTHWENAWALYSQILGTEEGRYALKTLERFIFTLGKCAACPMRFMPRDENQICRDECVILSLIAGLQHGNENVQQICVENLSCRSKSCEIMASAAEFASILKANKAIVLPISEYDIWEIINPDKPSSAYH